LLQGNSHQLINGSFFAGLSQTGRDQIMQAKVKTRQDYQGRQDAPQQGGGISRQSGNKGSGTVAQQDYQGGRREDLRAEESRRATRTGNRSTHRNGARGR
jgi:hypothetical protein